MKITLELLREKNACKEGIEFVTTNNLLDLEHEEFINKLMSFDKFAWANWLIVRIMNYKQYVSYAIFTAEQVIGIYENKYPNDDRPRLAIEATKKCLIENTKENATAYAAAAYAAYAAAYDDAAAAAAAYAAAANAYAAAANADNADNAAYAANAAAAAAAAAAAYTAANAANAAYAANAAANAAYAANADDAVKKELQIKIINYGLELLNGQNKK